MARGNRLPGRYARVVRVPESPLVRITAASYAAEIDPRGATLTRLTRDGLDVVAPAPNEEWGRRGYFGHLLAPWPNRLGDGRYEFGGTEHQLAITEPARQTALHGLVNLLEWSTPERADDAVTFALALQPQPGYPFALDLRARFALNDAGLQVTIEAVNAGSTDAPYGVGFHPYLTVGRRIDACVLTLPAASRLESDDRGLPTGSTLVARTPYDFRAGRLIADTAIDDCFGDLIEFAGQTRVALIDPDSGRSASVTVAEPYRWLQVFTGDGLGLGARESIAVEPMTCPPNAFRTLVDLAVIPSGGAFTAAFAIA